MAENIAQLYGELSPWPSKERLASILHEAGLSVSVGTYSVRVATESRICFQHYGGDLGEPVIDADPDALEIVRHSARRISQALTRADIKHRFEIYVDDCMMVDYLHHCWPMGDGEPDASTGDHPASSGG